MSALQEVLGTLEAMSGGVEMVLAPILIGHLAKISPLTADGMCFAAMVGAFLIVDGISRVSYGEGVVKRLFGKK